MNNKKFEESVIKSHKDFYFKILENVKQKNHMRIKDINEWDKNIQYCINLSEDSSLEIIKKTEEIRKLISDLELTKKNEINSLLSEIVLCQSHQDLCGQILKKSLNHFYVFKDFLLTTLEQIRSFYEVNELNQMASDDEILSGMGASSDPKLSQDEVDDLFKS